MSTSTQTSEDKIRMVPDSLCQSRHPNMYMIGPDADLSKKKKDSVLPFFLINLSHTENIRLKEKHYSCICREG